MPQRAKGPRLYWRKDKSVWIIRDTGRGDRSTGCEDRGKAEKALAQYIAQRDRPSGPLEPSEMNISVALARYGDEHAPTVAAPERLGYAMSALDPFWGGLTVSAITKETCRRYGRSRTRTLKDGTVQPIKDGTIRRELNTLRAALQYNHDEGFLTRVPKVHMPDPPPPTERWLTRSEAAAMIWAALRSPNGKHLARFILIGIYTGTRKEAILALRFMPNTAGGWVDLDAGVIYRRAIDATETNKRTPPSRIAPRLLAHLKRWKRMGANFPVEIEGQRVGNIRKAWSGAVKRTGIPHCSPHCTRHTAATWIMQRGVDTWHGAALLGMSEETLRKVYGHHHPDFQKEAANAIGRKL